MARPEVTGRKVESTTVNKKKGKRQRRPLPPRREGDSYTIAEFCAKHRISESFYFKLRSLGLGPREGHAGRRVIISPSAEQEWQAAREAAASAA
jgi:hypothetical protein